MQASQCRRRQRPMSAVPRISNQAAHSAGKVMGWRATGAAGTRLSTAQVEAEKLDKPSLAFLSEPDAQLGRQQFAYGRRS